ncbi:MAG: hypothetical protein MUC85_06095 [Anaerolineales bacterium]|nr:hypothetical protein [Anaerolineales bacterium]
MENEMAVQTQEQWKTRVMLIGGTVGLLTGLAVAYLLVQRSEKAGSAPLLNSSEGVKLGLLVLGLLRQVTQLGDGK